MLTREAEYSLHKAILLAKEYRHEFATLDHLLIALLETKDLIDLCDQLEVDRQALLHELVNHLSEQEQLAEEGDKAPVRRTNISTSFQRTLQNATLTAQEEERSSVDIVDILLAILQEHQSTACYFLVKHDLSRDKILRWLSEIHSATNKGRLKSETRETAPAQDDSVLEKFCVNLTKLAQKGTLDPLIAREKETERLIQILARRTKNNPLLVGEAGVGKTAIVEGLAQMIVEEDVPDFLKGFEIYSLDMGSLLSGARYRGDFEERLNDLTKALLKKEKCLLFIDEIHTIVGSGTVGSTSLDTANLLKPALSRGQLRCIGATTYKEYRQKIEQDSALTRRFQKIDIAEPSASDTLQILQGVKSQYEAYHNVRFTPDALKSSVELAERYLSRQNFPDKALDLLDEAAVLKKLNPKEWSNKISTQHIEKAISHLAHIPEKTLKDGEVSYVRDLDARLKDVVFGQDEAINTIVPALKLSVTGLRDHEKVLGSYLLAGPTGVGKTELARQVASLMHLPLVRFDMSEYMEKHSIARLIGAPPGYIGYDQGGLLTDAIDKKGRCVLLLDEVEKAHPDLFNILLQVLDYGTLTDHRGKEITFRNVLVFMTTNAGAADLAKPVVGFGDRLSSLDPDFAIKRFFSPEFINRLDAILFFNQLGFNQLAAILDKFLKKLEAKLLETGFKFTISSEAQDWLLHHIQDRDKGARPIERLIDQYIKLPLADHMLALSKKSRKKTVNVDVKKGNLAVTML